jgi:lipoprotein-releasing system permease protein
MFNSSQHTPGVRHAERYSLTQGILKTDADFLGVAFKGLGSDYDLSFLQKNLVAGEMPRFSTDKSSYQLLISQQQADKLRLEVGDRVYAYFIGNDDVRARKFTIKGIYQTNMNQFDQSLCFTDFPIPVKLNGWGPDQCSGVEVLVDDFDQLENTAQQIVEHVNRKTDKYGNIFTSQTIYEAYPHIFSWLSLLDINVWIILALMVCVAGFTMISGLLIIILERTQTIGTLKALGAPDRTIRRTFLWLAVFIVGRGMIVGNVLGIGALLLQRYCGIVSLDPQTYYVAEAPVVISLPVILLINLTTFLISVLVLVGPSYFVATIHPAESMRYE